MKKFYLILSLSIFAMGFEMASMRAQTWKVNYKSDTSGTLKAFVALGNNLVAGTYAGAFLSTDGGTSFAKVSGGLSSNGVVALSDSAGYVYAGTQGAGVYVSNKAITSWTPVSTGISGSGLDINGLTANGNNIFASTFSGIYLSTNAGTAWTSENSGLSSSVINCVLANGSEVFAGTFGGGVFYSSNTGASWTAVNTGLSNTLVDALVKTGGTLFAGTGGGGVFVSTNNGGSWAASNTGLLNLYVNAFAVEGSALFAGTSAGVYKSTDNGKTWSHMSMGITRVPNNVQSLVVNSSGVLFAVGDTFTVYSCNVMTGIGTLASHTSGDFRMYPNPVSGQLFVGSDLLNSSGLDLNSQQCLKIFDVNGKLVLSEKLQSGGLYIDLSALSQGVYSVCLLSGEACLNKRLVIAH